MSWKLQSDLASSVASQIEFKSVKFKNIQLKNYQINIVKDLSKNENKNENLVQVDSKGQYLESNKLLNFKLYGQYSTIDKSVNAHLLLPEDKMKKYSITGVVNEPRLELKK